MNVKTFVVYNRITIRQIKSRVSIVYMEISYEKIFTYINSIREEPIKKISEKFEILSPIFRKREREREKFHFASELSMTKKRKKKRKGEKIKERKVKWKDKKKGTKIWREERQGQIDLDRSEERRNWWKCG